MKYKQRGVAAVELALILPLLLAICFAVTEFGRAIYTYNTLAKSTRDASRYLSTQASGNATAQANWCGCLRPAIALRTEPSSLIDQRIMRCASMRTLFRAIPDFADIGLGASEDSIQPASFLTPVLFPLAAVESKWQLDFEYPDLPVFPMCDWRNRRICDNLVVS